MLSARMLTLLFLLPLGTAALREMQVDTSLHTLSHGGGGFGGCPDGMEEREGDLCGFGKLNFSSAGTINAQALFTEQIARAIEDERLLKPILSEVRGIWEEHDETVKEMLEHFSHTMHDIENKLLPATFLAEHGLEHFLVHGLAQTLHFAAHGLAHGASSEVLAALSVGTETLGSALSAPFIAGMQGLLLYVKVTLKNLEAWEQSAGIANALIQKADCLRGRFYMRQDDVLDYHGKAKKDLFKPDVAEICGEETRAELAKETLRANQQLLKMFSAMVSVGKCLYPAKYKGEKVKCVEAITPVLRMSKGEVGLLHSALSLANAFATATDNLLTSPRYGSYIDSLFNLHFPKAPDAWGEVHEMAERSPPVRAVSCVALVATQRAYAASFEHFAEAIEVWMRSFSRELLKPGFSSAWHPCTQIFNPLTDEDAPMCKMEHYSYPDDRHVESCSVAYT
eukprot:CAMPEP_0178392042 /NCGR_PEP_ID=MMETSP0689_2-20121128/11476_1 /TAXON_ID=160604 /ORGANISM="Amphidinium massartii, Strain CS-259" /LENGTH=452 /DNA_ID=CAMNT_0020012607 /DNA_START=91 /DNA_END=1445 /DNA_ORIENTATION=-